MSRRYHGNMPWYLATRPQEVPYIKVLPGDTLQPKKLQEVPWKYAVVPCSQAQAHTQLPQRCSQRGPERPIEAQIASARHRDAQRGPERPTYIHDPTYIHKGFDGSIHANLLTYLHTYIHTYTHTYIHTLHRGNYIHRGRCRCLHAQHEQACMHMYTFALMSTYEHAYFMHS